MNRNTETAIIAAGCFWGVEYFFQKFHGVLTTEVGYCGGHIDHPTYEQVCSGHSGHIEALKITYDPQLTSYEKIIKFFFEIHDPTQTTGQGPDIGEQYLSAIFYLDEIQKNFAESLIKQLNQQGYIIATRLIPAHKFWPAENYHQNYYKKTGKQPYCHRYTKRL